VRLVRITADFLAQRGQALKVYFSSDRSPAWCEEQSLEVAAPDVAGPVPLLFDFSGNVRWAGTAVRLRIDLERARQGGAEVELHLLELLPGPDPMVDLVLPPLPPVPGEEFPLLLTWRGDGLTARAPATSTTLAVTGRPHGGSFRPAGADGLARTCFKLRATEPGLHEMTLLRSGTSGPFTAEIWVPDP